jgi:2Fe-2S ferredoxin
VPQIRLEPHNITIQASEGSTVLDAARAQGLFWPSTCGGQGRCTSCTMRVVAGHANLSPMSSKERAQLASLAGRKKTDTLRLACQAQVLGDVTVFKAVVIY